MRMLLRLIEPRRRLVGDKSRISNRLTDALKQYFPDVLDWFRTRTQHSRLSQQLTLFAVSSGTAESGVTKPCAAETNETRFACS
jgi:hypothetical protein